MTGSDGETMTGTNPGSFDELHRKTTDVFPMCFEGAKVMVQKGLSSHFQISHTLSLSPMNTGYRFGATFVGAKQSTQTEAYPVVLGDTDISGNTSATVIHQLTDAFKVRLQAQVQKGAIAGAQGTVERRGRLSTVSLTLANTDLIHNSGVLACSYLRRLTPRFDVGVEWVNLYGPQPERNVSALSYAMRYTHPNWTAAISLNEHLTHLSYYHKQTNTIQFGCEFQSDRRVGEACATLAYQAELPEEGLVMRASVDTNWRVAAVVEKRLSPYIPFTLAMSGLFQHVQNVGKFGIGLIIG